MAVEINDNDVITVYNEIYKASYDEPKEANDDISSTLAQHLVVPIIQKMISTSQSSITPSEFPTIHNTDTPEGQGLYQKVFEGRNKNASTAELLLGLRNPKSPFQILQTKKDVMGDPLAFAVGSHFAIEKNIKTIDNDSTRINQMHRLYNLVAQKLFENKVVSLFGFRKGVSENPKEVTAATSYVGGIQGRESMVAAAISGWWFIQPTHQSAAKLFRAVYSYIQDGINKDVKNNFDNLDMTILRNAALQTLEAKSDAWNIDDVNKVFNNEWIGVKEEKEKPIGTKEEVMELLEISEAQKKQIEALEERDPIKRAIGTFFEKAANVDTVRESVKLVGPLMSQLLGCAEDKEDKIERIKRDEKTIEECNDAIKELEEQVTKLKKELRKCKAKTPAITSETSIKENQRHRHSYSKNPSFLFLQPDRINKSAATFLFGDSHPEILCEAFSKETVNLFNTIASSVIANTSYSPHEKEGNDNAEVADNNNKLKVVLTKNWNEDIDPVKKTTAEPNVWLL